MFRLIRRFLVLPVMVIGPVWLALDNGMPGLLFGWLVMGYVIWRALPAIRDDLVNVRSRFLGGGGAHSRGARLLRASRGDL